MHIDGEIKNIIFRNEETGYSVLELLTSGGELITAVGIFPPISEGLVLSLDGDFKRRNQYGLQFETEKYFISDPVKLESIKKYLSSGLIRGLGKVTAQNIIDKFGLSTLDYMSKPHELARVNGISLKRATEFSVAFEKARKAQETVIFLQGLGVSINMSLKIYRAYGNGTVDKVKKNPYMLVEDIDGIGFITADGIAATLGIAKDSDVRISAGIIHTLKEAAARSGNTYLPREQLVESAVKLLKIGSDNDRARVSENLDDLILLGQLKSVDISGNKAIMLVKFFNIEKSIATRFVKLAEFNQNLNTECDLEISQYEKENGIELHESQREAVKEAVNGSVVVITGGPGTGKTTIVKCILESFKNMKLRVALCAPTGRAAKRMTEATGVEAKTIHRLIDIENDDNDFSFSEYKKLPVDAVIVDEASMVDEYVFNALLKSVSLSTKLIIVGDGDQLPSVGAGNVLHDIIKSKICPVKALTHIYRQAQESGIVMSAHAINSGRMPSLDNSYKDFYFIELSDSEKIKDEIVGLCTKRLPKYLNISPFEVQVLSPMKKGISGTTSLNSVLQNELNPKTAGEKELYYGDTVFRKGDKVMHTQNNYQLSWALEKDNHYERGKGVFNGDIGTIELIDKENFIVKFEDGRQVNYSTSDLEQLSLAYATTIHKSQGSEFDAVVISLEANFLLQSRNLIYTAVTRAKKMAVLVGSSKTLKSMISKNQTERYTLLKHFIESEADDGESR
ncbi:MAG: ATP-dependent RecD-like DNA helicase [Christensenellales bacterium]